MSVGIFYMCYPLPIRHIWPLLRHAPAAGYTDSKTAPVNITGAVFETVENPVQMVETEQQGVCAGDRKSPARSIRRRISELLEVLKFVSSLSKKYF